MNLSVIIPTFNEIKNGQIETIIQSLILHSEIEIIIVNKNSTDGTAELVQKYSQIKLISTELNSRAARLNIGINAATGSMILLHHPRSILEIAGISYLKENHENLFWGGFTHEFDNDSSFFKFTSWYSNKIRGKLSQVFYLDHCIFAKASLLKEIGPIPEVDIFEDTLLSYKLRKIYKPILLPFKSQTSAIRFNTNGIFKQVILNQILKIRFYLKANHRDMNKSYEKKTALNSKY